MVLDVVEVVVVVVVESVDAIFLISGTPLTSTWAGATWLSAQRDTSLRATRRSVFQPSMAWSALVLRDEEEAEAKEEEVDGGVVVER